MTRNVKISIALVAIVVLAGVTLAFATDSGDRGAPTTAAATTASAAATGTGTAAQAAPAPQAIRPDSHRLSTARDGRVTLVEFLDFECESCRALYPYLEQLRAEYDGRVTFAIRYFPIASHTNAQLAAQAVEAASLQGRLEPMYRTMFETQAEWGESQESRRATFLGFASRLGLDMDRFRRDLDDPRTAARIARDQEEGLALGVQGTPTLFLNGEQLQLESVDQLKAEIDAALAGS
ncbi:DsbA family protein [Conexibacter woesei]|uniref:DSBA oxidoreductase n=1 Tax=Conexibacter woesei (strain DSM 14684 / CCUG 47730 / CIP 108061 / JCM 11494 / NBRC 100937 / ID131577) TaxID=469383 RepID=D3F7P4_CONWI|nr:DsbA family protein [Conexibacter woesei]ADB50906.1 DSBA oxidoreductase [Conexibacter woesei DSM 14684]